MRARDLSEREWAEVNREHAEQADAAARALTPAELLARGQKLSAVAAAWRRAAWDAQRARPAA
jgi:hypothetical protein